MSISTFAGDDMRLPTVAALAACVIAGAGTVAWFSGAFPLRHTLRERRESLLDGHRPFLLRLSGEHRWQSCRTDSAAAAGDIRCAGNTVQADRVAEAVALARDARLADRPDAGDAGWALAVIDLLSGRLTAAAVASRIASLEALVAADSGNAALRNDLAVAYFLRGDASSAFLGLEQIERAYATDSSSPLIAFNRALALDEMHLSREARAAWSEYLRRHGEDGWSGEANGRLADAERRLRPRLFDGRASALASETARDPQHARELVLDSLLPRWANAVDSGHVARADSACRAIATIGGLLAASSGDQSVNGLAGACASSDPVVARATRRSADGAASFRVGAFVDARPVLRDAANVLRARGQPSLAAWADVTRGFVEMYAGRYARADSTFAMIEREATSRRESALAARALWGLALSAGRHGGNAADYYARAADLYGRLGERINGASMMYQTADILFRLGRDEAALRDTREAFALFDQRLDARARPGPYTAAGLALVDLGLPAAAVAVLREALAETATSERKNDRAEALVQLANAEVAAGHPERARTHIVDALRAVDAIDDPLMRERHEVDAALTLASLESATAADSAIAGLSRVADYYRRTGLRFNRAVPLARLGQLRLRRGDTTRARQDISAAVLAIEQQQLTDSASARDQAAARREVFDALVTLDIARGDTAGAFIAAEGARGSEIRQMPRIEHGRVVLSYYSLPDRLLLWISDSTGTRGVTIAATPRELHDLADRMETLVRRGVEDDEWQAVSRSAFDLLVEPATSAIQSAAILTVVPDGALGRLPFAALLDADGTYLGKRAVVTYAAATRRRSGSATSLARPVVVGQPSPDPRAFPELGPLPGATREVRAVRDAYPAAVVIADSAATKQAVSHALRRATLFHFAGHAQLVERLPSQSRLVLATSAPGGITGSVLSAEEIARMDLRHLGLAILSSCGTTQARSRRDDGQAGLSAAFFTAGARAVISSRWVVDDAGTAELMELLHAELARGTPGAIALSRAQAALMDSRTIRRPLTVWAAFVYEES